MCWVETSPGGFYAAYTNVFSLSLYSPAYVATSANVYEKDRWVCKLYELRKNGFTCHDSKDTATNKVIKLHFHDVFQTMENSAEAQSRNAAPRRAMMPLYVMSRATAPALKRDYNGKKHVDRITKSAWTHQKQTLKNFRIMYQQWRHDHNRSELSSLSYLISNNDKRARRRQNRCCAKEDNNVPSWEESQHCRLRVRNIRPERTLSSWVNLTILFGKLPASETWDHAYSLGMYPVFVSGPYIFLFGTSLAFVEEVYTSLSGTGLVVYKITGLLTSYNAQLLSYSTLQVIFTLYTTPSHRAVCCGVRRRTPC